MSGRQPPIGWLVVRREVVTDVGDGLPMYTEYSSDMHFHPNRRYAIAAGAKRFGDDDFLVVECGDGVERVAWLGEDRDDPDERAEIARQLGLEAAA